MSRHGGKAQPARQGSDSRNGHVHQPCAMDYWPEESADALRPCVAMAISPTSLPLLPWAATINKVLSSALPKPLLPIHDAWVLSPVHPRPFTDSAPGGWRSAGRAMPDLGWIGKHTNLIIATRVVIFFLGGAELSRVATDPTNPAPRALRLVQRLHAALVPPTANCRPPYRLDARPRNSLTSRFELPAAISGGISAGHRQSPITVWIFSAWSVPLAQIRTAQRWEGTFSPSARNIGPRPDWGRAIFCPWSEQDFLDKTVGQAAPFGGIGGTGRVLCANGDRHGAGETPQPPGRLLAALNRPKPSTHRASLVSIAMGDG